LEPRRLVRLTGDLVTLHLGSHLAKLVLQRRGFRIPEFLRNRIAEAVLVHTIEFGAQKHLLLLQTQHGGAYELLLVSLALPKHGRELAGEFGRDPNLFQELAKLTNQLLFANVRVAAWTAVPGAVVVDVLALLDPP
jgi:hypothetical protein